MRQLLHQHVLVQYRSLCKRLSNWHPIQSPKQPHISYLLALHSPMLHMWKLLNHMSDLHQLIDLLSLQIQSYLSNNMWHSQYEVDQHRGHSRDKNLRQLSRWVFKVRQQYFGRMPWVSKRICFGRRLLQTGLSRSKKLREKRNLCVM